METTDLLTVIAPLQLFALSYSLRADMITIHGIEQVSRACTYEGIESLFNSGTGVLTRKLYQKNWRTVTQTLLHRAMDQLRNHPGFAVDQLSTNDSDIVYLVTNQRSESIKIVFPNPS